MGRRRTSVLRSGRCSAFARDGHPHRRGQRVAGALAQHLAHDGRRDHGRCARSKRPAPHHLPADGRQLLGELGHPRLVRVGADEQADRFVVEADVARARRRSPHPGGDRRRVALGGEDRLAARIFTLI